MNRLENVKNYLQGALEASKESIKEYSGNNERMMMFSEGQTSAYRVTLEMVLEQLQAEERK